VDKVTLANFFCLFLGGPEQETDKHNHPSILFQHYNAINTSCGILYLSNETSVFRAAIANISATLLANRLA